MRMITPKWKTMKNSLAFIVVTISNIVLFVVLQIISQFVHFFVFGEGTPSDGSIVWVSLFFAVIQLVTLILLLRRGFIIKTNSLFITNIIIVIGLFVYYALL